MRSRALVFLFGVAVICIGQSVSLADTQVLVNGVNPKGLSEIFKLNQEMGVISLRSLSSVEGTVLSVPNPEAWLQRVRGLNEATTGQISVTPLSGDYRSLFHRIGSLQTLSGSQEQALNSLRKSYGANNINVVQLAPRALVREAMTVGFDAKDGFAAPKSVTLEVEPGRAVTVTQTSNSLSEGGVIWRGKPADSLSATDDAVFIASGGNVTGTLRVGRDVYTYLPLGNGIHAVTKQGTGDGPPEHPPRFQEVLKKPVTNDAPLPALKEVTEDVRIDVLVVFSKQAVLGLNDETMKNLVRLAMEDVNQSFVNSGVPGVTLNLANVTALPYSEAEGWNTHLDRLVNPADPLFRSVHKLRDQVRADLVVLVVNDSTWCGEARDINAVPTSAFAVVSRQCLLAPRYSFAHELGHLLGARHDRITDPATSPFRWAHGYVNAEKWRTIMAYDVCNGCPRLALWSNPNARHAEEPTGTIEFEYDARVWLEQAKRVSNFR
jgi:peptidyl-Asp metalloendopeptidase